MVRLATRSRGAQRRATVRGSVLRLSTACVRGASPTSSTRCTLMGSPSICRASGGPAHRGADVACDRCQERRRLPLWPARSGRMESLPADEREDDPGREPFARDRQRRRAVRPREHVRGRQSLDREHGGRGGSLARAEATPVRTLGDTVSKEVKSGRQVVAHHRTKRNSRVLTARVTKSAAREAGHSHGRGQNAADRQPRTADGNRNPEAPS